MRDRARACVRACVPVCCVHVLRRGFESHSAPCQPGRRRWPRRDATTIADGDGSRASKGPDASKRNRPATDLQTLAASFSRPLLDHELQSLSRRTLLPLLRPSRSRPIKQLQAAAVSAPAASTPRLRGSAIAATRPSPLDVQILSEERLNRGHFSQQKKRGAHQID